MDFNADNMDQTCIQNTVPGYIRAKVKFDPSSRSLDSVISHINIFPARKGSGNLERVVIYVGTAKADDKIEHIGQSISQLGTGDGTIVEDFWKQAPNLDMYKGLLENYDVAAIEEAHMQAASKYGW